MKKLFVLFLLCSCKQHICPLPTKVITRYDSGFKVRIDTLVIIETIDSVPFPITDDTGQFYCLNYGYSVQPNELFKDGKRADTIRRFTIKYYKPEDIKKISP